MLIFNDIHSLKTELQRLSAQSLSLGFVPTMGALHAGHLSLLNYAATHCDVTVCSIFVNPTQFNDKKDLERYPRRPEEDKKLLQEAKCDILFMPDVQEMYAGVEIPHFELGYLNSILEAQHRPGHFDGVAQVVYRLFDLVKPTKAFFGSKDFQQVLVVKRMCQLARLPVEIFSCPIIRESDGLAMSSRNLLLTKEERVVAGNVSQFLQFAISMLGIKQLYEIQAAIEEKVAHLPSCKLDYFEFANPNTLLPVTEYTSGEPIVALIAMYVGKIRLIDNQTFNF